MRKLRGPPFDKHRVPHYTGELGDDYNGCFHICGPTGKWLSIIASSEDGWDHVSVGLKLRPPWWKEMEWVKRLFFEDHETAIQYHVPVKDHINVHPNVLHMWRWHGAEIPLPPKEFV